MCAKILCKSAKGKDEVSAAASDARSWANDLILRESRGPGDTENAMRRLEHRYGIPWRTFWAFRYRPPPDVFVSVYDRLRAAYHAECERQTRLLKHEIEISKIIAGPDAPAVRAAEALLAENETAK